MTTIAEVAEQVIRDNNKAMSVSEIFDEIQRKELYKFGAKNPRGVLSQAIREKSNTYAKAKKTIFRQVSQGTYELI